MITYQVYYKACLQEHEEVDQYCCEFGSLSQATKWIDEQNESPSSYLIKEVKELDPRDLPHYENVTKEWESVDGYNSIDLPKGYVFTYCKGENPGEYFLIQKEISS